MLHCDVKVTYMNAEYQNFALFWMNTRVVLYNLLVLRQSKCLNYIQNLNFSDRSESAALPGHETVKFVSLVTGIFIFVSLSNM